MKHYIYHLITNNIIFYIGRTNDPIRRLKDHIYSSRKGHEDKYVAIRAFEQAGLEWTLEVIAEVELVLDPRTNKPADEQEPYEEYYMMKALENGCQLTNMKMGDVEMCVGNNLKCYADMQQYIAQKQSQQVSNKPKTKKQYSYRPITHIDDLRSLIEQESPAMKRIRQKRKNNDK